MGVAIGTKLRKFLREKTVGCYADYLEMLAGYEGGHFWRFDRDVLAGIKEGSVSLSEMIEICRARLSDSASVPHHSVSANWITGSPDEQRTWMLKLYLSRVPCAELKMVERYHDGKVVESILEERDALLLISLGIADVVEDKEKVIGKKVHLYIDQKINSSAEILKAVRAPSTVPTSAISEWISRLTDPQRFSDLQEVGTVHKKSRQLKLFLNTADEEIVERLGFEAISAMLTPIGIDAEQWLAVTTR